MKNKKNYTEEMLLDKIEISKKELQKLTKKYAKLSVTLYKLEKLKFTILSKNKHNKNIEMKLEKIDNEILFTKLSIIDFEEKISSEKNLNINPDIAFNISNVNVSFGTKHVLKDINVSIWKNKITAIIGPSGCGKSTFLRSLNRINDETPGFSLNGEILLYDHIDIYKLKDIYNPIEKISLTWLRTKIGMIFQQPNPFPMSIYKNVIFGPKVNGVKNQILLKQTAINSLIDAGLYEEVKTNLDESALGLSGGQQQRLCIARALANDSEVLLMDEPTSALDPIAAAKIEELMLKLKEKYTIIFVTHSMQQAARISDYTIFFYQGKIIEFDKTSKLFTTPKEKKTDDYIRGKFG